MREELSKLCKLNHARAVRVNAVDELINVNSEAKVLKRREARRGMQDTWPKRVPSHS